MEPFIGSLPLVKVEELVRRAQRGDAIAVEALLREVSPYVGRICGAIALDAAEDAMQETLMAVFRHIGSLEEPAAFKGWVRRIAVREAVRAARGSRVVPVDPDGLSNATSISVPDAADAVEVRAILASLSPEQRAVLTMRHLEGLNEEEMVDVLAVAAGTVKSRLHRARAAFRDRWIA
jgi:RNA polymerase sigma factor (sigma-70 family)